MKWISFKKEEIIIWIARKNIDLFPENPRCMQKAKTHVKHNTQIQKKQTTQIKARSNPEISTDCHQTIYGRRRLSHDNPGKKKIRRASWYNLEVNPIM
jgi:hypothetical protein